MSDRDFARLMRMLQDEIRDLRAKQDDHDRRLTNMFREAKVTKLDAEKGMVEVEADGLPSAMVPWSTRAGTQKEWDPPSEGERVILISINGEPGLGVAIPGGYSDKNKQPHDKAGEHKRTVGEKVSVTTTAKDRVTKTEKVTVTAGEDTHKVETQRASTTQTPDKHTIVAAGSKLETAAGKVLADSSLFRATKKVILASG